MTLIRAKAWSLRYRVAELQHFVPADEISDEHAFTSTPREYRTLPGAEAYQAELVAAGRPCVLQFGVVQWLGAEDATAEMQRLQHEGGIAE